MNIMNDKELEQLFEAKHKQRENLRRQETLRQMIAGGAMSGKAVASEKDSQSKSSPRRHKLTLPIWIGSAAAAAVALLIVLPKVLTSKTESTLGNATVAEVNETIMSENTDFSDETDFPARTEKDEGVLPVRSTTTFSSLLAENKVNGETAEHSPEVATTQEESTTDQLLAEHNIEKHATDADELATEYPIDNLIAENATDSPSEKTDTESPRIIRRTSTLMVQTGNRRETQATNAPRSLIAPLVEGESTLLTQYTTLALR